ncbi:MAG: hypothetical protein EU539_01830 [Promethearchaeota archaeon]|nr:MAG: hypothetical protein EU539_01830 [Candidatus Lokiarchaeota archaeon]
MNYSILDAKLKSLIRICKETANYKKLAVVSFIITSNLLNEIGMKLGLRPRKVDANETIFNYMVLINKMLEDNFKFTLFKEDIINKISLIEKQFLKTKGEISIDFIIDMYEVYYEIRKLKIPNLYGQFDKNYSSKYFDTNLLSNFYSYNKGKQMNLDDKITKLLIHDLRNKELSIQKNLRDSYRKEEFEDAIYLKKVKHSLKKKEKGKIEIKGRLKDNITYQESINSIFGYFLMGFFVLFFILGLIITIETIYDPSLTMSMSYLFVLTFGTSILFFIFYWNYFKE